jgi:hypothetical protein
MFYHVRITQKSYKIHDETKLDLSEEQLKIRFIEPYEQGKSITINGKTIELEDIERIRISRSSQDSKYLIRQLEAEDASSPVLVLCGPSYEWRAADKAEDVTDDFIKGPPGLKKGVTRFILKWIVVPIPLILIVGFGISRLISEFTNWKLWRLAIVVWSIGFIIWIWLADRRGLNDPIIMKWRPFNFFHKFKKWLFALFGGGGIFNLWELIKQILP